MNDKKIIDITKEVKSYVESIGKPVALDFIDPAMLFIPDIENKDENKDENKE